MSVMPVPSGAPKTPPLIGNVSAPAGVGHTFGQPARQSPKQRPCAYYQRTGTCRYGAGCRFSHALPTPGGERLWSHAQAGSNGVGGAAAGQPVPFTFMTYNVLADSLAQKHWAQLYRHVPRGALAWDGPAGRGARLLAEIARHAPDILALQEVDRFQELRTALAALGYEGQHLSRTGGRSDGCATFWKRSAFELVDSQRLCFEEHALRDNVALLTLLQPRGRQQAADAAADQPWHRDQQRQRQASENGHSAAGGNVAADGRCTARAVAAGSRAAAAGNGAASNPPLLLVGNTHILFNPKRGDIKLAQVRVLLEAAAAMADAPTVVAGDFNSAPASGVHRFCSRGELELPGEDRSRLSGQHGGGGLGGGGLGSLFTRSKLWSLGELETAMGRSPAAEDAARGIARHPLALRSAYVAVDGAEPVFSTSHGAAFTTVDYIWYTPEAGGCQLQPTAVLLPPHPSAAAAGLPSMELPSDHIPLLARFELVSAHPGADPGAGARASGNGVIESQESIRAAAAAAVDARAAAVPAAASAAGSTAGLVPDSPAAVCGRQPGGVGSGGGGEAINGWRSGGRAPKFVGIGTVL